MTEEKEIFKIALMKKTAKEDAKSYQIRTVQDIADCVTDDNIEGFLHDFEFVLRCHILLKAINEAGIKEGKIPEGSKIELPSFEWIDD